MGRQGEYTEFRFEVTLKCELVLGCLLAHSVRHKLLDDPFHSARFSKLHGAVLDLTFVNLWASNH